MALGLLTLGGSALLGCGGDDPAETTAPATPATTAAVTETPEPPAAPADPLALPDDLPNGLMLGYSDFAEDENGSYTVPQPRASRSSRAAVASGPPRWSPTRTATSSTRPCRSRRPRARPAS
jgi:hypothetical protein